MTALASRVDVDAFERRVLLDAYLDASAVYWERRARQLEAARPCRDDYTGHATTAEVADQWNRLTAAADACRNRAAFLDASAAEVHDTLTDLEARGAA